jgi:hypothetical protein
MVIQGFNLWCIKETQFSDEGNFDMDYQWFFLYMEWFLVRACINKLSCPYCIQNNKAFIIIYGDKMSFFIVIDGSCQRITSIKRTKRTSLLVELKWMLHRCYHWMNNYMMLCRSTITLCLVFNLVSSGFLILV